MHADATRRGDMNHDEWNGVSVTAIYKSEPRNLALVRSLGILNSSKL